MPEDMKLAHPEAAYELRPHQPGARPELPLGHGGIAVFTWFPRVERDDVRAPMVGVDGRPALQGWGRALIVVPAGERIIEVQDIRPRRSARVVVGEGEVVEFEYTTVSSRQSAFGPGGRRAPGPARLDVPLSLVAGILGIVGVVVSLVLTVVLSSPALLLIAIPSTFVALGGFWRRRANQPPGGREGER